ncbi:hypothetical protein GCK32_000567 [Trichostrongylus colubriformis]|uniref:Uncharacterized protein n=1 Tax=Trichostrongylus colubriformis TaxID=6319 RepID=A0AAN8EVQ3_TRICO
MASFLVEAGMFLSLLELLVEMTIALERYAQIVMDIRAVIAEAERTRIRSDHTLSGYFSVPLLDSPSSAQPASVRLRAYPMTRT